MRPSFLVVAAFAVATTDAKGGDPDPFFLEANKLKDGVVSLPSGLQYKVLKSGEAEDNTPPVTMLSRCTIRFEGSLPDGTVFAPSTEIATEVRDVFAGWQEALKLMLPGDHWTLWVPAALHSWDDERAAGKTVVFDFELIGMRDSNSIFANTWLNTHLVVGIRIYHVLLPFMLGALVLFIDRMGAGSYFGGSSKRVRARVPNRNRRPAAPADCAHTS